MRRRCRARSPRRCPRWIALAAPGPSSPDLRAQASSELLHVDMKKLRRVTGEAGTSSARVRDATASTMSPTLTAHALTTIRDGEPPACAESRLLGPRLDTDRAAAELCGRRRRYFF